MTLGRLSCLRELTLVPSRGFVFVYMMPPQNVIPERVTPAGVSSHRFPTISCKRDTTTRFGVKSAPCAG